MNTNRKAKKSKLSLPLIGTFLGMKTDFTEETVKKSAELAFVTLALHTGAAILDRSYLANNMASFFGLPKPCRDYLIDIFLAVKIPGCELQKPRIPSTMSELLGPSNPFTSQEAFRPQFGEGNLGAETSHSRKLVNRSGIYNFYKELRQFFTSFYKQDPVSFYPNGPEASADPRLIKLNELLNPKEGEKQMVHEILMIWIVTNAKSQRYHAMLKIKEHIMDQLRAFFNEQFAALVPETSSFFLVNRSYYVNNRRSIDALPEEAQTFIQECMLTAPTKGHKAYKNQTIYHEEFYIISKEVVYAQELSDGFKAMFSDNYLPLKLVNTMSEAGANPNLVNEFWHSPALKTLMAALESCGMKKERIFALIASGSQKEVVFALKLEFS